MVSASNALGNLKKEQPGFDFEGTRAAAREMWRKELARIHVEDSSEERKTIFYLEPLPHDVRADAGR